MERRTSIKKVPVTRKKVVVVHSCTQTATLKHLEDNINKLSIIITGDGHPEESLNRKVALIGERQKEMNLQMHGIRLDFKDYVMKVGIAQDVALTAKSAFEQYRASLEGEEKGKSKASTHTQVTFSNIVNVIGTIVIVLTLIATVLMGRNESRKIDERINNLGTPVIVNPRGLPSQLPAGDSLKFYRNGEFKNGIRDSNDIQTR